MPNIKRPIHLILTCPKCGNKFPYYEYLGNQKHRYRTKYCSLKCLRTTRVKPVSLRTGTWISGGGYVMTRIAVKDATGRDVIKERSIHRLVWISVHGEIGRHQHIHHVNGNRTDNRIENLVCMTASEHKRHHNNIKYGNYEQDFII